MEKVGSLKLPDPNSMGEVFAYTGTGCKSAEEAISQVQKDYFGRTKLAHPKHFLNKDDFDFAAVLSQNSNCYIVLVSPKPKKAN